MVIPCQATFGQFYKNIFLLFLYLSKAARQDKIAYGYKWKLM
jgi:hypothetical protein